jgi:isopentenyl diphosphate isomerase/L-lactate dehydrogenase-like FMN-dependent dehydrogenase
MNVRHLGRGSPIGRRYIYRFAVAGAEGVGRVVEILRSDLEFAMILCGCASISQIDKTFLWRRYRTGGSSPANCDA